MAENQEQMKPKEREIPVFTVLKNSCILKNIFLLDKPPSITSSSSSENVDQESEIEEILVVGRHPDCNIKLEHPSISRCHLRIHSKPSSRSLFVTDLSSVHGTWVSGKRIEAGVTIKVNEGDTLQLGASSRLYRLNWVPLSRAYDIDDPFVDAPYTVDEETEVAIDQDGDTGNKQGNRGLVDGLERLSFDEEDICLSLRKMSPTAPPIPEDFYDSLSYKDEVGNIVLPEICNKEKELSSGQLCQLEEESEGATDQDGDNLPSKYDEGQESIEGLEWLFSDEKICNKEIEQENSTPQAHLSLAVSQTSQTTQHSGVNSENKSGLSIWSRRGKPESVKVETSQSSGNDARINVISSQVKSLLEGSSESMLKDHQRASPDNDDEIFTPDKENASPNSYLVRSLKFKFEETLKGESFSNSPDEDIFTPDKENMTPDSRLLRSMKNVGRSGEVRRLNPYRPSPLKIANNDNTYHEEVLVSQASQHRKVLQESKLTFSVSKSHGTVKKKQQPVLKATAYREPFHPLPVISTRDHKADSVPSGHESTMRNCSSANYLEFEDVTQSHKNTTKVCKNRWTIVADTTCLLNRKSRNELQLLRGLQGTTLLIPRIVVRELDCMLRRASFFSRMTEASAALKWVEDCMAETKWWIHVQSSAEEGRLVPPTPPAAAASSHWFSDDKSPFSVSSVPFSPYTLQEIVTPTPADHILECALLYRRTTDGQLVLLSEDVTLKIKAMAEGVICETAEEFRGSVVNPFSPRFLYSNSSPIGPTWSGFDDTVLKENYYPSPARKNSKSGEGAKGLKLILLHNSNFRQMTN